MDKRTGSAAINVPYLMELVEESGMNRAEFCREKLMRGHNYLQGVIASGRVSKMMIDYIAKATGGDARKLSEAVPYDPKDYRLSKKPKEPQPEKDGTIADYIALISDSLIELAKNQVQSSEVLTMVGKLMQDNAKYNSETNKLFEVMFQKLKEIDKKVDEIHRELK